MRDLRLRVDVDGEVYTYTNADILTEAAVIEERIDDIEIELADVELVVTSFLDVDDPLALEAGQTYRALLDTQEGDVLLDGAIRTDDVDWDDRTKTWRVVVTNAAQQEFWASLQAYADDVAKSYYIDQGIDPPGLVSRTLATIYPEGDPVFTLREVDYLWYDATSVLEMLLLDAGMAYTLPQKAPTLYTYEYETEAGTIERESAPIVTGSGYGNVPHWTGERYVEQLARYAGWRIRVEYGQWPSAALDVSFIPARWPDAGPSIDDRETSDAHGLFVEGVGRDYALQMGEIERTTGDPAEYELALGEPLAVAVPPGYASYAPDRWDVEPHRLDDELEQTFVDPRAPRNAELEQVDFQVAAVVVEGSEVDARVDHDAEVVYGKPYIEQDRSGGAIGTRRTWSGVQQIASTFGSAPLASMDGDDDRVVLAEPYTTAGAEQRVEYAQVIEPDLYSGGTGGTQDWSDDLRALATSADTASGGQTGEDTDNNDAVLIVADTIPSGEDLIAIEVDYQVSEVVDPPGEDGGSVVEASIDIQVRDDQGTVLDSFDQQDPAAGTITLDGWTAGDAYDIRIVTDALADAEAVTAGSVDTYALAEAEAVVLVTDGDAPEDAAFAIVGSVWARSAVQGHEQMRAAQRALEVDAVTDADIVVADPDQSFSFRGAPWVATEKRYDTRTDVTALEARQAAAAPARDADTPQLPAALSRWRILNLSVDIVTYPDLGEDWLICTWTPPALQHGRVWRYDVESSRSGSMQEEAQPYATSFVLLLSGTSPSIPFDVRVRPRWIDGSVGAWVFAQAS